MKELINSIHSVDAINSSLRIILGKVLYRITCKVKLKKGV